MQGDQRDDDDAASYAASQEQQEYCTRAAMDIATFVETGGLPEVNSLLEKHGYKVISLSDVLPVR
jgi:hypothetical protein